MKKIITKIINLFKIKTKMAKTVKLKKCTPQGKPTSNNTNMGKPCDFILLDKFECNKYCIQTIEGQHAGWVYDYEIDNRISLEVLEAEKKELIEELELIDEKINWVKETKNVEFNSEEFKVYRTLKLLEQKDLTILEKTKLIANLIKD